MKKKRSVGRVVRGRVDLSDWGLPDFEQAQVDLAEEMTAGLERVVDRVFGEKGLQKLTLAALTEVLKYASETQTRADFRSGKRFDLKKPLIVEVELPFGDAPGTGPVVAFDIPEIVSDWIESWATDRPGQALLTGRDRTRAHAMASEFRRLADELIKATVPEE